MQPAYVPPQAPAPGAAPGRDDDIPDALLEGIPDAEGEEEILELQPIPEPPTTGDAAADLVLALVQARRHMEGAISREFSKLERSFPQILHDLEAKLMLAEAELQQLRADHARAKAEHDRKTAALRDLKRALEGV
jgi:hypothetical protein